MSRKNREKHHQGHRTERRRRPVLMRPLVQVGILLAIAAIVFIILQNGKSEAKSLPLEISVDDAYAKYQNDAFLLDVRTQDEWNEYHAPNTTLIPLDELPSRLGEIPHDKEIVVVCRSGNRSRSGRDILLSAGFQQVTSMAGGLNTWRDKGYPIEP